MTRPEKIYQQRIAQIKETILRLRRKDLFLASLKLPLFILLLISLYRLISRFNSSTIAVCFTLFAIFTLLAMFHERTIKQKEKKTLCQIINQNEISALQNLFIPVENGEEYQDDEHPYAADLDLFGNHSLFHYLNRTTTAMGKEHLAQWLQDPSTYRSIEEKQQAIQELRKKIDFRQAIQCHGWQIGDTRKHFLFLQKLTSSATFLPQNPFFRRFLFLLPAITLIFLILSFYGISWLIFLAFFLLQASINARFSKRISSLYLLTSRSANILKAYGRIIAETEGEVFSSPLLISLQDQLRVKGKGQPASRSIKHLSSLFQYLQLRLSSIHFLVNNILLWDLNLVFRIENWKNAVKDDVFPWLDVVGRMEALSSLANVSFNNPQWALPGIERHTFILASDSLGHPLIAPRIRVNNSLSMKDRGVIHIITGPNMSGKSTYLKTVGVNLVLAMCGSVVCATAFTFSPVNLYSSMKVSDSLDQQVSLFYAELKRLKNLIDGIQNQESVFFIIDEMLKGTNVADRQKGAIALLKQLIKQRANGMVATHDLELTKLSKEHRGSIKNHHFDGYIDGDKLLFDYRLKKGVCRSFNALILMKKMGIQID
jgi:DNA mismatch repair ATPase MutS